jgi:hypothetical protein
MAPNPMGASIRLPAAVQSALCLLEPPHFAPALGENFGVALDPQPAIIPFHKVWTRLQEIRKANGGKMPRILRNGQLIRVKEGKFKGIWRVFSAKNNASGMALDIGSPDAVRLKNKTEATKLTFCSLRWLRAGWIRFTHHLPALQNKQGGRNERSPWESGKVHNSEECRAI